MYPSRAVSRRRPRPYSVARATSRGGGRTTHPGWSRLTDSTSMVGSAVCWGPTTIAGVDASVVVADVFVPVVVSSDDGSPRQPAVASNEVPTVATNRRRVVVLSEFMTHISMWGDSGKCCPRFTMAGREKTCVWPSATTFRRPSIPTPSPSASDPSTDQPLPELAVLRLHHRSSFGGYRPATPLSGPTA